MLGVLALAAAAAGAPAHAQRATELFAPAQLRMAESYLEQARAAQAIGEYDRARRLAQQAALDARLAWGMSDSPYLRRSAAEVHERSARLRYELTPFGAGQPGAAR